MNQPTIARRSFLRGLAGLPLIGGGVAILGNPTAAAVPVSPVLLESYRAWLVYEERALTWEMAGGDVARCEVIRAGVWHGNPGADFHGSFEPPPSARAAVVLSAAGVPLIGGRSHG